MKRILQTGWKQLLLLSIAGGLASIIMMSCGGVTPTEEVAGNLTIEPAVDKIPAGGDARFYAFRGDTNIRYAENEVTWAISSAVDQHGNAVSWTDKDIVMNADGTLDVPPEAVEGEDAIVLTIQAVHSPEVSNEVKVTVLASATGDPTKIVMDDSKDDAFVPDPKLFTGGDGGPTDADKLKAKYYRAFPRNEDRNANVYEPQAEVTWSDGGPGPKWADNKHDVRWETESATVKAAVKDGKLVFESLDAFGTIKLTAYSKLKKGDPSHTYEVDVKRGVVDSIIFKEKSVADTEKVIDTKELTDTEYNFDFTAEVAVHGVFSKGLRFYLDPSLTYAEDTLVYWDENPNAAGVTKAQFLTSGVETNETIKIFAQSTSDPDFTAELDVEMKNGNAFQSRDWKMIRMGIDHSIAIAADDGKVYVWGRNQGQQIGFNSNEAAPQTAFQATPKAMDFSQHGADATGDWIQVTGGWVHSMALNKNGNLFMWGAIPNTGSPDDSPKNFNPNQMGVKYYEDAAAKNFIVKIEQKDDSPWKVIAASYASAYAINEKGDLYAWGLNNQGQLGVEISGNFIISPEKVPRQTIKLDTDEDLELKWTKITAGKEAAYGITEDGKLYVWGNNASGELGLPRSELSGSRTPYPMTLGGNEYRRRTWRQIYAGYGFAAGIDNQGQLYTWGSYSNSKGGESTSTVVEKAYTFTETNPERGKTFTLLSIHGSENVMAITNTGYMYLFGHSGYGQLGNYEQNPGDVPNSASSTHNGTFWMAPRGTDAGDLWASIVTSGSNSLAVNRAGDLYAWGYNRYGQLSNYNKDVISITTPTKVVK